MVPKCLKIHGGPSSGDWGLCQIRVGSLYDVMQIKINHAAEYSNRELCILPQAPPQPQHAHFAALDPSTVLLVCHLARSLVEGVCMT